MRMSHYLTVDDLTEYEQTAGPISTSIIITGWELLSLVPRPLHGEGRCWLCISVDTMLYRISYRTVAISDVGYHIRAPRCYIGRRISYRMSDMLYRTSDIISDVGYHIGSRISYRSSELLYRTSDMLYRTSDIISDVGYAISDVVYHIGRRICYIGRRISYRTSDIISEVAHIISELRVAISDIGYAISDVGYDIGRRICYIGRRISYRTHTKWAFTHTMAYCPKRPPILLWL